MRQTSRIRLGIPPPRSQNRDPGTRSQWSSGTSELGLPNRRRRRLTSLSSLFTEPVDGPAHHHVGADGGAGDAAEVDVGEWGSVVTAASNSDSQPLAIKTRELGVPGVEGDVLQVGTGRKAQVTHAEVGFVEMAVG